MDSIFGVEVELSGVDGNAFFILGQCQKAARRAGIDQDRINEFTEKATSGDYDHLLQTAMTYFEVS